MTGGLWIARILALAGFLDAAYLTASHYAGQAVACGPGGGCELVLTSRYATVVGVPIALFGVAYYAAASLMAWTPPGAWNRRWAVAFAALVGAALSVSSGLVWLQAARIGSWCRFCLVSAGLTLLLFLTALWLLRAEGRVEARTLH